MSYTNSSLICHTHLSPYHSGERTHPISKITIHHMAGDASIETCGNIFQSSDSSSNYGIGTDGRIAMYVEEKNRSWASDSRWNDNRAVTIEVANCEYGGDWKVSDKALASLIKLCVDICKRNGMKKLEYTGDENGSLTIHSMFAPTACPGPYLKSKLTYIANEVTKQLNGGSASNTSTTTSNGNSSIKSVQSWLNSNYNADLDEDGIYGPLTQKALVKALQTELNRQCGANLVVDGIFGAKTKAAVCNLYKGLEGNLTKTLQGFLICNGYDTNGFDGIFGNGTESAVEDYQRDNGLSADGIAGKDTFSSLCA